jgi:microcystin-dependent protein
MTTLYRISPPPAWFWFGADSQLLADGKLQTFEASDQVTPKAVSLDEDGTTLVTEVDFDSQGRLPPVYFANDAEYYIKILNSSGALVLDVNDFPPPYVGFEQQTIDVPNTDNHIINGQFYFPHTIPGTISQGQRIQIADGGWFYETDNSINSDNVEFESFVAGQVTVEGNPPRALKVSCDTVDSNEVYKYSGQALGDVSSFSGQQITFSAQFQSDTNATVEVIARQYFGTGGSPSPTVDFLVGTVECGTDFQKATFTVDIPTISGKTIGSNGDDSFQILTNYPIATIFTVQSTNYQQLNGDVEVEYLFQTKDEVGIETKAKALPRQDPDGADIGKSIRINSDNEQEWFEEVPSIPQDGTQEGYVLTVNSDDEAEWLPTAVPTGAVFMWPAAVAAPTGYLLVEGQTISRTTYAALFAVYGTTWGAGDGSTTFTMPDWRGRSPLGAGTGSGLTARTVGQTGGEETHVLTTPEIPSHSHNTYVDGTTAPFSIGVDFNGAIATGGTQTGLTGGGGAHNTMHPFAVTNWIVKT